MCVYTASHMQFINCLDAGECGMIVGPHSTKLPQSWDTGSDQTSVPASFDVFLFTRYGKRLSRGPQLYVTHFL